MLQQAGIEHEIVLYMKTKPDAEELATIVGRLEDEPGDLVRRDKFFKDKIIGEQEFDETTLADPDVVIDLLAAHPRLLQRPVVMTDEVAIIGRPRDRVPALFGLG